MDMLPRKKIDEDLFLVLRTIFHYERMIAERYGLDFEEIYTLQVLRRQSVRVTDLAGELQLPMFTVSRMVNRLAEAGYLSKEKDDQDKRNIHLRLCAAGEEALQKIEASSYEQISQSLKNVNEQEIKELMSLAEKLHLILGVTGSVIK